MRAAVLALAFLAVSHSAFADPAPTVPPPPVPPKASSVLGSILDGALLGGRYERAVEDEWRVTEQNYAVRLTWFVEHLSPEQLAAIMADPKQADVLTRGLVFVRVYEQDLARTRAPRERSHPTAATSAVVGSGQPDSETVYDPSECIGAVVMGVCHGSILPESASHPVCHGEMINGMCTGPMF